MKMLSKTAIIFFGALVLIAFDCGKSQERLMFEKAKEQKTVEAYKAFEDKYPNSRYLKEFDIKSNWVTRILNLDCKTNRFEFMYNINLENEDNGTMGTSTFTINSFDGKLLPQTKILCGGKIVDCSEIENASAIKVMWIGNQILQLEIEK